MNLYRWWRMRRALRRRSLIAKLRVANQELQLSLRGLRANENYNPTCMGGVEDKYAGERQWQHRIVFWSDEIRRLSRSLGLNQLQAAKYW